MTEQEKQKAKDQLEAVVDMYGVSNTLDALSEVCFEKAEHIRTSYSENDPQVELWTKVANSCSRVTSYVSVRRLAELFGD